MSKEIYNEFYKKHGANVHRQLERFLPVSELCKGHVLDVGCGTGDLADHYNGSYVGIDISDVAIDLAKKIRRKPTHWLVKDATLPSTSDFGKFDTIVLTEFLEHIPDDTTVFENIRQWAKPDTRLIVSVPNGDRVPDKNHIKEYTMPELRRIFSPFGKVRFHNWPGFEQRILLSVDMDCKDDDLISLSMIVWNEAPGLERTILSCIDFVDNIVISVDYKSDDGTLKIAERYADTLKRHTWNDNFAEARNWAKQEIKTEWTLTLDGHEYVKQHPDVREKLKTLADGLMVKVRMEDGHEFYSPRIARTRCNWKLAVHNYQDVKTIKKYKDFRVIHDRTKGQTIAARRERSVQRNEMITRILTDKIKEDKKDSRSLLYLGNHFKDAIQYKEAIKTFKKFLKVGVSKSERWHVCYMAGELSNALSRPFRALGFFRQAEKEMPNRWEISKRAGMTYLHMRSWQNAIRLLVDSLKINTGDFITNPELRNDADTYNQIGFCFYQWKKYDAAGISWNKALAIETDEKQKQSLKNRIEFIAKYHKPK